MSSTRNWWVPPAYSQRIPGIFNVFSTYFLNEPVAYSQRIFSTYIFMVHSRRVFLTESEHVYRVPQRIFYGIWAHSQINKWNNLQWTLSDVLCTYAQLNIYHGTFNVIWTYSQRWLKIWKPERQKPIHLQRKESSERERVRERDRQTDRQRDGEGETKISPDTRAHFAHFCVRAATQKTHQWTLRLHAKPTSAAKVATKRSWNLSARFTAFPWSFTRNNKIYFSIWNTQTRLFISCKAKNKGYCVQISLVLGGKLLWPLSPKSWVSVFFQWSKG